MAGAEQRPETQGPFIQTEVWPDLKDSSKPTSIINVENQIYRSQRIAGKTYATRPAVLKEDSEYGQVDMRFDHGTDQKLPPTVEVELIDAFYHFGELQKQIDDRVAQQRPYETRITNARKKHSNARGAEFKRLGLAVTQITEVGLDPIYELIRKAVGDEAISKIAFEKLVTELILPPGIRAEEVRELINLALRYKGIDPDDPTTVTHKKGIKLNNRELLIELANRGIIPMEAVNPSPKDKMDVNPLTEERPKAKKRKASE